MRRIGAALLLALAFTATAPAATTALDAKRLALQPSDLPAAAKRMSQKENRAAPLPGGTGHAYTTTFQFQAGRRLQAVGTIVIAAPSPAVARRVFAAAVAEAKKSSAAPLQLPKLGDDQYAALYGRPSLGEASGLVWVRRNTVVWQVQVSSVTDTFGFSASGARRELATYAVKQQRRIGAG